MSFDPERWLEVAARCCRADPALDREALLRTALNRAYYAALLSFRRRIENVHGAGAIPKRRTHDSIYRALGTGGSAFDVPVRKLRELRRWRERADYELTSRPPHASMVRSAVRQSRWLIRAKIKGLPDAEFRRLVFPAA